MATQDGTTQLDAKALERILEVTRALARPADTTTMLASVIDAGRSVLGADRGTIFLYDAENEELVAKVATGEPDLRVPADRGIVGECAKTRSVINVPDCYSDPRFNQEVDRKTGYRTRCLLTIPLVGHDDSLEGVLQVLNKKSGTFTDEDERVATALAAQCAVALQRTRLLKDLVAKERMERELLVARQIQMRVLPQMMPQVQGYDVSGWSRPADQTGGDIFDFHVQGDGRLVLLLGDATGHGIGPALSVTQVRAMLRMCLRFEAPLVESVQHINDQLAEDLSSNRFVTAFLGMLDPTAHSVEYIAAGQGPLLHFRAADETAEWLDSSTRPLGILGEVPIGDTRSLIMEPGDILVLATDGIFEYENPAEEQFGQERVAEIVRAHQDEPMVRLIDRFIEAIDVFAQGTAQADDMTIVLLRRLPG
ncbi:MAG: GAF domain-containing SpoIIE family protein phosphatase [Acidobacteriota bacterium]